MPFVLYVRRRAKILILNKERIIEKNSYESVDEKRLSYVMSRKRRKKEFMHLRVKEKEKFVNLYT